jgi:hypothetical protein
MKTKIRMTSDAYGCEDGFTSRLYKKGEIHEVEHHLANNFVAAEAAEHHEEEKEKQTHENKTLSENDYDNKAIKPNKRKGEKQ